tara:strand:- start:197 stop:532 length:336 start_codon:yes stop_codon:yes gene_type:complete
MGMNINIWLNKDDWGTRRLRVWFSDPNDTRRVKLYSYRDWDAFLEERAGDATSISYGTGTRFSPDSAIKSPLVYICFDVGDSSSIDEEEVWVSMEDWVAFCSFKILARDWR